MKKQKMVNLLQHNYLSKQYLDNNELPINHNYLTQQFSDTDAIMEEIKELVQRGDFTLGQTVDELEDEFIKIAKTKYAIGVGSGTDAIFLSLKALGIDKGDEVITTPYTFYATIGAIVTAGATPVFVDVGPDYNIDPEKIEKAITPSTKAIVPVHWSGLLCDMEQIHKIAENYGLFIVEDACHAINAERNNIRAGALGSTACFSMHPLKNLNVWGDGGMIVTNSEELHEKLVLYRNHGLIDRNLCEVFSYNSRLDTLQAIVGKHLMMRVNEITDARIRHANWLDEHLNIIPEISIPIRPPRTTQVFHIYVIKVKQRDELQQFLIKNGIDAKVHYPIPMHLQPAAKKYGYKKGDFPIAEATCDSVISLPVHEFITIDQLEFIAEKISEFYQ